MFTVQTTDESTARRRLTVRTVLIVGLLTTSLVAGSTLVGAVGQTDAVERQVASVGGETPAVNSTGVGDQSLPSVPPAVDNRTTQERQRSVAGAWRSEQNWSTKGYDNRNTGYNPDALAPTGDVRRAWSFNISIDHVNGGIKDGGFGFIAQSSPAVVDGTAYIGDGGHGISNKYLYAVDTANGSLVWRHTKSFGGDWTSSPTVANGLVYAGTGGTTNALHVVDAETGENARSQFPLTFDGGAENPTVANGSVYFGAGTGKLYSYDAQRGFTNWVFELQNGNAFVTAAPAVHDGTVYVATFGRGTNRIYAVNARTGAEQWNRTLGTGFDDGGSQVTVANGRVYVGTTELDDEPTGSDVDLWAFDAATGSVEWTKSFGGASVGGRKTGVAYADGAIFVGTNGGNLYALNAATGTEIWQTPFPGAITHQPTVANGMVYVGDATGQIHAIDAGTGQRAWARVLDSPVAASPTPANGSLFVPAGDELYKFVGVVEDNRGEPVIQVTGTPTPTAEPTPTPTAEPTPTPTAEPTPTPTAEPTPTPETPPPTTVGGENSAPSAEFTYGPRPAWAQTEITFDASASRDTDGEIVAYRWDFGGDGTVDAESRVLDRTFSTPGTYEVVLTVVDDDGAVTSLSTVIEVVERPTPQCRLNRTQITAGDSVAVAVTGLRPPLDIDLDGDGEYEYTDRESTTITVTYDEAGTYEPRIHVRSSGDPVVLDCGVLTVAGGGGSPTEGGGLPSQLPGGGEVPLVPVGVGGGTVGLGGALYYLYRIRRTGSTASEAVGSGRGSGGSDTGSTGDSDAGSTGDSDAGTRRERPDSDRGRSADRDHDDQSREKSTDEADGVVGYETGVFGLPTTSGELSVTTGFRPDVVLFWATNGCRTDGLVDRTAGWSRGIAVRTPDGSSGRSTASAGSEHPRGDGTDGDNSVEQRTLTVADDAEASDAATCTADAGSVLELVHHRDGDAPSRVSVSVTATDDTGFTVAATVPGGDPLSGGERVLYTAIAGGSTTEATVGQFSTPMEPGPQAVPIDIDADHVSVLTSTSVEPDDTLWTTDQSVGVSVGYAVSQSARARSQTSPDRQSQVVAGTNAWPARSDTNVATCDETAVLDLLYQNGRGRDGAAGGPDEVGDRDERVDRRIAGRTRATATAVGEQLQLQYDSVYSGPHKLGSTARHPVTYFAVSSERLTPAVGQFHLPAPGREQTVTLGFQPALIEVTIVPTGGAQSTTAGTQYPFAWSQGTVLLTDGQLRQYVLHHTTDGVGDSARQAGDSAVSATDSGSRQQAGDARSEQPAPDGGPSDNAVTGGDDQHAGIWLPRGADGTVGCREQLRVTGATDVGFRVTSQRVGPREPVEDRPTVVYRAWPAVDEESQTPTETESPDRGGERASE